MFGDYQRSAQDLQAQGRNVLVGGNTAGITGVVGRLQSLTSRTLDQLTALSPPPSVAPLYRRALKEVTDQHQALADALSAEAKHDQTALQGALTRYASKPTDPSGGP